MGGLHTICCWFHPLLLNEEQKEDLIRPREKIISSKFKLISCCRHGSVYLSYTEAPSWIVAHSAPSKTLLPSGMVAFQAGGIETGWQDFAWQGFLSEANGKKCFESQVQF